MIIDSPLGKIFRIINIVEYKSPGDYLSIADYHKVLSYVHLYCALNGLRAGEVTISFVTGRHPRTVLRYLREELGFEVQEGEPGIYQVRGGEFGAMQVIETGKLREEDGGIWLRELRRGLKVEELKGIIERGKDMPAGTPLKAYLRMVAEANRATVKELVAMSNAFEKVMEECGLAAKWERQGLRRGVRRSVKKLQEYGMAPAEIAKALELPLTTVLNYLKTE
ncbi:MAG: hypothetical protein LBU00_02405 [Treponema sp.]|nr:hypothetical protein [Treponema sp.]